MKCKISRGLLHFFVNQAERNWPQVPTLWTPAILSAAHLLTSTPVFCDRIRLLLLPGSHASLQSLCESSQVLQLGGICRSDPYSWIQDRRYMLIPGWSYVEPEPIIRFTIPGLLARGKLRSHGAYVESHEDHTTSIPLIIFSVSLFHALQPAVFSH